ncbi:MAG: CapA family protein [Parcubacteria group bacterium]
MRKTIYITTALIIAIAIFIFLAVTAGGIVRQSSNLVVAPIEQIFVKENKTVSLFAVGDIMLSRNVGQKMVKYDDYHYPFLNFQELISSADIAFGNLESPIIAGAVVKTGSFSFRADPQVAEALNWAGFDVLSLANNHILNQGQSGLDKTIDYLSGQDIDYCGAQKGEGDRLKIKEVRGLKIGFLCYAYGPTGSSNVFEMNEAQLQSDLEKAKGKVDFIVVSMHDGVEYAPVNSTHQQKFARAAIDAGADLIIGHHTHVVQNMEQYKGKYIFYSLGNFVFDQMWSTETRQGLAIRVDIDKSGVQSVDYYPLVIDDYSQPRQANATERDSVLKRL